MTPLRREVQPTSRAAYLRAAVLLALIAGAALLGVAQRIAATDRAREHDLDRLGRVVRELEADLDRERDRIPSRWPRWR